MRVPKLPHLFSYATEYPILPSTAVDKRQLERRAGEVSNQESQDAPEEKGQIVQPATSRMQTLCSHESRFVQWDRRELTKYPIDSVHCYPA